MRILNIACAVSIFALIGCGGDEAGTGTSAPSPTPAPTPVPTPTPAPVYTVTDYSADFALSSSIGYMVNYVADPTAPGGEKQYFVSGEQLSAGRSTDLVYRRSPESVDFGYDRAVQKFTAVDRVQNLNYTVFEKPGQQLLLAPPWHHPVTKYVTLAVLRSSSSITETNGTVLPGYQYRIGLFGTPTRTTDPLPDHLGYAGKSIVYGGIPGSRTLDISSVGGGQHTINWSYTPSSNDIFGSVPLVAVVNNQESSIGILSAADGKFDAAANSISGTLIDRMNGYHGTFRGQIFGPDRAELIVVFEFSRDSDGSRYFGHYIGKRD